MISMLSGENMKTVIVYYSMSGNCEYAAAKIAEKTGASTATISRVNRSLMYGQDGYGMVFDRLKTKNKE